MSRLEVPWQQLVETAREGVCVLDAQGRVQYANSSACALLNLAAPAGTPLAEWLSGLDGENQEAMLQLFRDGGQVRLDDVGTAGNYLRCEAERWADAGITVGRIYRDDAAEAAHTTGIMIHELRLPMTSIMGYAKMLLSMGAEDLTDLQRQFLNTINRNVERLNRDLSAMQEMSRLERRKLILTPVAQVVAASVRQVVETFESVIEEQGHQVVLDFPSDLPPVWADPERFQQVLRILLDNAVKYTPATSRIQVTGRSHDRVVQIDVQDNGPGIPAVEQRRIFTKFFRGEADAIRAHTGLGLGLCIARGLVELHGGKLWFESTRGEGSTFSFTLPVRQD
jgi:signal transduction histidine kinase